MSIRRSPTGPLGGPITGPKIIGPSATWLRLAGCSAGDREIEQLPDRNLDEPIGDVIRQARREMGLSQQQLAEQVNRLANHDTVTGHEVGRWETHQRIPRPYWRQWLGAALSVPIDQLNRAAVVTAFRRAAGDSRVSNDARAGSGAVPPQTLAPRTSEEVLAMWDQLVGRRQVLSRAGPAVGAAMIAAASRAAGSTRAIGRGLRSTLCTLLSPSGTASLTS